MRYCKLTPMSDSILKRCLQTGVPLAHKKDVDGALRSHSRVRATQVEPFGMLIEDYVLAEEDYWRSETSRPIIFPENEGQLRKLMSGDYIVPDAEGLSFPFESAVIAMPKGFTVDGVELPTCLVTWTPALRHLDTIMGGYRRKTGQPYHPIRIKEEGHGQNSLSITIKAQDSSFSRVMSYQRYIPNLLACKSVAEYRRLVGNMSDELIARDLDEYDSRQQFMLMKLVAAIGVYVEAYGEEALQRGFRLPAARTAMLPKTLEHVDSYTLRDVDAARPAEEEENASVFVQFAADTAPPEVSAHQRRKDSRWIVVRNPSVMPTDFE